MQTVNIEPVSNREDWQDQIEVFDDDGGLVDLTDATIVLELADKETKSVLLSATTDNGKIVIDGDGTFSLAFTLSDMRTLEAKTYNVGCTILLNDVTRQFFVGTIAVMDGVVS
jgi:hypothetical protein